MDPDGITEEKCYEHILKSDRRLKASNLRQLVKFPDCQNPEQLSYPNLISAVGTISPDKSEAMC